MRGKMRDSTPNPRESIESPSAIPPQGAISRALKDAFKKDIEILFGYVSMGFCCGVLLKTSGYDAIYALIMSVFVYSGVMQFLAVSFFGANMGLWSIFFITLILNSRQSFYTLIMLEKYRRLDFKRFFNIFWLTDETFAILKTKKPERATNEPLFIFFIGALNYAYWGFGCVLGAVAGGFLHFDTRGLDFIMTAIFVVILIDQCKKIRTPRGFAPVLIGVVSAVFWLVIMGGQYFLLAAIATSIAILAICYHKKIDFGDSDDSAESRGDSVESRVESADSKKSDSTQPRESPTHKVF